MQRLQVLDDYCIMKSGNIKLNIEATLAEADASLIKIKYERVMNKKVFTVFMFFVSIAGAVFAQTPNKSESKEQAQVMVLGVFHFAYPNADIIKVEKKEQLDVTTPENQHDIEKLVKQLAKYKPTKIAVEVMSEEQELIDSLYQAYLEGRLQLRKSETYQIGFRLAKMLGHQRVYCIDTWGNMEAFAKPGTADFEVRDDVKARLEKFWVYQDSVVKARAALDRLNSGNSPKSLYKILQSMNHPESIHRDHSNYFREAFMYEEKPHDYTGVDWYSASWYNRNLRVFRNIQRITESPQDRILMIYGAGHLALLQHAIQSSPMHRLVPAHKYLK